MKLSSLIFTSSAFMAGSVTAFSSVTTTTDIARPFTSTQIYQFATAQGGGMVDVLDIYSPRDVYSMDEWATQYGMQKADGVELYSEDGGSDYSLMTQGGVAAGQSVVYVPASIVLNSASVQQEFGTSLQQAEAAIVQIDQRTQAGAQYRLPLFRLMVKILVEYEKGQESMYYPWLNSLPRQFFNGVSMTKACFKCLPPYAGWLTSTERINYSHFAMALRQGYVPLSQQTISNKEVVKWAYNVALTRFHEVWQPERTKLIAPMADMLNHAAEPNCEISVDYEGNVNVVALYDVPAGSALTISLGDPTNPTPIFAQYGFLPQDCATIFCKAMHLEAGIRDLGYEFGELLFQTETGEIAPKVWDIFLYDVLQQNDPGSAQQFCMACQNNDEATKQNYQDQYFPYTLDALKQHVYSIMSDSENLTYQAQSYDLQTHPRVPVIVAHNQLVSQTFGMTAALLEQMG
mmetsp:Transcript_13692/g.33140  ORF Transcript_13692/g.33140 Transcript_13692/m.33140 type:complete len:460 (-) Transcript_13692:190-1569(-)|eukprot:CAMPEP_0181106214 /NCGR_PEP_ID=MMETSP1071-20121207/16409_1 /TAXON_ID=35127 /ORGANISM="Thalassiosira sp., Strain NH16" /LENGTH=459 /DNA_ID=CAMNT_0023189599 /DNA_START=167 /DNA_END=1546 /DNA_ORIENTATION=+